MRARTFALVGLALGFGCPQNIDPSHLQVRQAGVAAANDPNVIVVGDDLYPKHMAEKLLPQPEPKKSPGTGKPDETNGTCRLYAPQQPDPICCPESLGFDAALVGSTCGLPTYLGESVSRGGCNYYFHGADEQIHQFRVRIEPGNTPAEAAADHDHNMRRVARNPAFASTPVPNMEGAVWSSFESFRWVFFGGWSRMRLLTWKDSACSDAHGLALVRAMMQALEPERGAPRPSLVPTAARRP